MNRRWLVIVALILGCGAFLFSALSGDVYELTSPTSLHGHTVLRKLYSIVAFAAIGYLVATLVPHRPRRALFWIGVLAGASFSAFIEIWQAFVSSESLEWHLIDVACGALGGAIGGFLTSAPWVRRA